MPASHNSARSSSDSPRVSGDKVEGAYHEENLSRVISTEGVGTVTVDNSNGLHRGLTNRKLQLVAIGSSIGTALFLAIGGTLNKSGPGNLFIGFILYNIVLCLANNCMAEMTVYMPVGGSFVRLAGHWVDDALGFCAGWNFFLYQALTIPFEITALSLILSFYSENIPAAAITAAAIVGYVLLNIFAVRIYGEAEFWLASGKVLLLTILLLFTFVTAVGGNPAHDAYGFRYWYDPGAFPEYRSTGALGGFEAFIAALFFAAFTCVGPEYVGMAAAESQHPRTYVKTSFKIVYLRVLIFFCGGALAVGVLVPWNDPVLEAVYRQGTHSANAAASPYIIAMKNLNIPVLPYIITALLTTTIFSAGNNATFCASRTLYGLALEGRAPAILKKCTKSGIPIYAFGVTTLFALLGFLQLSNSSATVLSWLINLTTGAIIIDYIIVAITYICFYKACRVQNFDRSKLPYQGWFQPYGAWIVLIFEFLIMFFSGYATLEPFVVSGFITTYFLPVLVPLLYVGWKVMHKTKWLKPEEVDLIWEAPLITAYEDSAEEPPVGFWADLRNSFLRKRKAHRAEA
ncbi:putative amino acid transporter [Rosellinia necatrix]|uniref:Putative amino acid transporter n=1 Tax=Rosellinia necatrix TaxID=77044 RepID=A0A1W2TWQ2_ROSNE|nr:putative amino acid transporter [Rosellinia necatrix]